MRRSIQRTIRNQNKSRRVFGKPETFSVHFPDKAGKGGKSDETDSYSSTDEAGRPQYDRNHGGTVPGTDGARSAVLRGGASKWNMGYRKKSLLCAVPEIMEGTVRQFARIFKDERGGCGTVLS